MKNRHQKPVLSKLRIVVIAAIVLFPALTNLVTHTGSLFFTLLTALGVPIIFFAHLRPSLTPHEHRVLWAFAAYTAVHMVLFAINGMLGDLADPRLRYLDRPFRFLAVIPLVILFRYARIPRTALWAGVLLGAWVSGAYAFMSYFWLWPGQRVSGSYHAIAFGHLSLVLAFMSIPALDMFQHKAKILRLIPLTAFILGMGASLLSGTRGAWIAIPTLTVILFYYFGSVIKLKYRFLWLGAIILFLFASYQIPGTDVAKRINSVFKELADYQKGDRKNSSFSARMEGWRVSFEIFQQNPVIGSGPGSYRNFMHRMRQQKEGEFAIVSPHNQPHGIFALAMAERGVLGFLALLGVFVIPLASAIRSIRSRRQVRHAGYAWLILIIGFMHFGLTETIFIRNAYVTFYIILTAAFIALTGEPEQTTAAVPEIHG